MCHPCRRPRGPALAPCLLLALALHATPAAASPARGEPGREVSARELWFPGDAWDPAAARDFRIGASGSFRVLILSDIQLESDPTKIGRSLAAVKDIVRQVGPDLILTTGDNAGFIFAGAGARRLARSLDGTGIPWGVTLGNHDNEGRPDRDELGRIYAAGKRSVFRPGPSTIHGVGNYGLTLSAPSGERVYSIIMLDSNAMRTYPDGRRDYDFIYPDQIAWYEWFVKGSSAARFGEYDPAAGKVLPSILVFHIPLPEFAEAIAARERGELPEATARGAWHEAPCPAPVNSGLFEAALRLGSTTEIIVGHDHVNDLSLPWKGIRLTYGVKTGPGSYSRAELQGGTLLTIRQREGTWVAESESVYLPRR